jgi:hypothetical protein
MITRPVMTVSTEQRFTTEHVDVPLPDYIEWSEVKERPPLCKYRDIDKNYISSIVLMCKKIDIAHDKLYVVEFRDSVVQSKIYQYLTDYNQAYLTAYNRAKHLIDVLFSCGECFRAHDYDFYRKIPIDIESNKELYKIADKALVPILRWEDLKIELKKIADGRKSIHPPARIIATLYLHGYVLRPKIITETVIGNLPSTGNCDHIGKIPTIDLNNGRWVINQTKSSGIDIVLNKDVLSEIRKLLPGTHGTTNEMPGMTNVGSYFLPPRSSKEGPLCTTCRPVNIRNINNIFAGTCAPSRCRKSFITWYIIQPGRTYEEIVILSKTLGNRVETMWQKYLQLKLDSAPCIEDELNEDDGLDDEL